MRRSLPVLIVVLSAALVLSGCSGGGAGGAAAKVGSTTISQSEFNDQLAALADNTKWLTALAPQFGDAPLTAPNGNVSSTFSAAWLTALINQSIVDKAFVNRGLKVTEQNKKDALASAKSLFSTDKGSTFESLPKWFRDSFLAGQRRYEAMKTKVPSNPEPNEAQLEDMLKRSKVTYCAAGNAVSHIVLATKADADAVEAALASGVPFNDLLSRSTDTGGPSRAGFLTCTGAPNWTQLPADFRAAVEAVPVGSISAPIQSDQGFHVVRVGGWDLADLRPLIAGLYDQDLEPPMTQFINSKLLHEKIWVDPRYGTVRRGPVRVEPPKAPTPRSKPAETPSTTAPAGSSGP